MIRIVFMGTPQFAVPILLALAERYSVVGVVTQPDRPAGRGRTILASAVKETAIARHIPVFQPKTLRNQEAIENVAGWQPDVMVVAAFGQILPKPILDLPPHGCLNVHASLLPRHRGAAPIPAAILAGEAVTGVTIMVMDEGVDTGPILAQKETPIHPDDTTGSLTHRLAYLGADLLLETLPRWLRREIPPLPQDDSQATFCRPLKKEDGLLDWARSALELDRQVRACDPWPGAYTTWQGRMFKIMRARLCREWEGEGHPGQIVPLNPGIGVVTGDGVLELVTVQLAGKKPMAVELFARGQRGFVGGRFGEDRP
ncbi:MAG: methionyl-tRNA formyltransferase [Anaerolineae bacterium]